VPPILIVLLNINCKHNTLSPTLNVNPTLFVIPCKCLGCYRFTPLLTKCFTSKFNHPWQYFSWDCWQERVGFWPSSIIHASICSLIHEKCHPKRYHINTKYHMTLNIIFGVVDACCEEYSSMSRSQVCRLSWQVKGSGIYDVTDNGGHPHNNPYLCSNLQNFILFQFIFDIRESLASTQSSQTWYANWS
jgi:hypothetical protein